MEMTTAFLGLVSPLALVETKLSSILQDIGTAEDSVESLVQNVKNVEVQLATVQEYLPRAELSDAQKQRCEYYIRDIEQRTTKLASLLDLLITRLKFKKVKQKLLEVTKDLPVLQEHVNKIGQNISTVREELLLAVAFDERSERRKATSQITKQLDVIEENTTDARKIRKQYRSSARMLMMDDFNSTPVYFVAPSIVPQKPEIPQRAQTDYSQAPTPWAQAQPQRPQSFYFSSPYQQPQNQYYQSSNHNLQQSQNQFHPTSPSSFFMGAFSELDATPASAPSANGALGEISELEAPIPPGYSGQSQVSSHSTMPGSGNGFINGQSNPNFYYSDPTSPQPIPENIQASNQNRNSKIPPWMNEWEL